MGEPGDASYIAPMEKGPMFAAIREQRHRLIETLEPLTDEQWNTPSLCDGWRVRDVVGHLVSILEIPTGRFVFNAVRARDFDRYADRVAREVGARPTAELLSSYRAVADREFSLPVVGPIAPLADVYVHTRDIERPLGRAVNLEAEGLMAVLEYACGGRARGFVPGKRTAGLRFVASDLDWERGTGHLVRGPAEAVMMAVVGRASALADLSGDGVAILGARLG